MKTNTSILCSTALREEIQWKSSEEIWNWPLIRQGSCFHSSFPVTVRRWPYWLENFCNYFSDTLPTCWNASSSSLLTSSRNFFKFQDLILRPHWVERLTGETRHGKFVLFYANYSTNNTYEFINFSFSLWCFYLPSISSESCFTCMNFSSTFYITVLQEKNVCPLGDSQITINSDSWWPIKQSLMRQLLV